VKEVFLIRHGQTHENESGILIGQRDPSLSARGREQVQALRSIVPIPDVVFSSDLRRASETANLLFPTYKIKYLPQLRERSFGSLEGRARSHTRDICIHQTTRSIEHHYGIESATSLTSRICQVLQIIQITSAKKIVVVGHGTFFRSMIEYLLPDHIPSTTLKNGQYHHLTFGDTGQLIHVHLNQSWI
jgi:broad specificity phosphatase PhoE